MLKKIFTLLCLAIFVGSMAACGSGGGTGFKANKDAEKAKPLSSENVEQNAGTEVY